MTGEDSTAAFRLAAHAVATVLEFAHSRIELHTLGRRVTAAHPALELADLRLDLRAICLALVIGRRQSREQQQRDNGQEF